MKSKFSFLVSMVAFLACLFQPGCANPPTAKQLANIKNISRGAGELGTLYALRGDSSLRPAFEAVEQELGRLMEASDYDYAKFVAALQKLPVSELRGEFGAVLISNGVLVFDLLAGLFWGPEKPLAVAASMEGLREGIRAALAVPVGSPAARKQLPYPCKLPGNWEPVRKI
jgi:hypothetical protein